MILEAETMTEIFKIKTQNFMKIFMLENFGQKVHKFKLAPFCIALFIWVTECCNSSRENIVNKRCFLWKIEPSKLPLFYWENSHFFLEKTISETHMIFVSKFKVVFLGSQFIFLMQKVYEIFGLNGRQISRLFIEKNDTSFWKKPICKIPTKIMEKYKVGFCDTRFIIFIEKQYLIFVSYGREISRLLGQKTHTSFWKKQFQKLTGKSCENLRSVFMGSNLIFSC